jgi:serine/threonine protein kinase
MEMRSSVESAFKRQVRDENGLAARENFIDMLEALGLTKPEADSLISEFDPYGQSHLQYKEFLDFIFGPPLNGAAAASQVTSAKEVFDKRTQEDKSVDSADKLGVIYNESGKLLLGAISPKASTSEMLVELLDKKPEVSQTKQSGNAPDAGPSKPDRPEGKGDAPGKLVTNVPDIEEISHTVTTPQVEKQQKKEKVDSIEKVDKMEKPDHMEKAEKTILDAGLIGETPKEKAKPRPKPKAKVKKKCTMCNDFFAEVFRDPHDNGVYCETCWINWYGSPPNKRGPALVIPTKIVSIVKHKLWPEDRLIQGWREHPMKGWPPGPYSQKPVVPANDGIPEVFAPVYVKLNPGLVGSHARSCTQSTTRPFVGELLCNRYRIEEVVGAGHFTRALLATDTKSGDTVCVKKHNSITVELLTDLLTIGHRLAHVDPDCAYFPRMFDAFYDIDGYSVESIIDGRNCLLTMRADPGHFKDWDNMRLLAKQGYEGLVYLEKAGVVHCDLKPDNIMWIEPTEEGGQPSVRLVDFGCSRLDSRLEHGRNWALAEGGAGHVGKWAPEMILRLRITHKADVWGLAVALLELYCGRSTWCGEADTVEVVLAQLLGLVNARNGLPKDLLKESPLDICQLYSPEPEYFPLQRFGTYRCGASFQELRPATWGLGCVLGDEDTWDEDKIIFASFVLEAMTLHHSKRPPATEMLTRAFTAPSEEANRKVVEEWTAARKAAAEAKEQAEKAAEEAARIKEEVAKAAEEAARIKAEAAAKAAEEAAKAAEEAAKAAEEAARATVCEDLKKTADEEAKTSDSLDKPTSQLSNGVSNGESSAGLQI